MSELLDFDIGDTVLYGKKNTSGTVGILSELSTARKTFNVNIRFRKGASHTNWLTGQRYPTWLVAVWNIKGTKRGALSRPFLSEYVEQNYYYIKDAFANEIAESSGRLSDRVYRAGIRIKNDLINQVYYGGISNIYPNIGKYNKRKTGHFGSSTPLVAYGKMMEDLEVIVN